MPSYSFAFAPGDIVETADGAWTAKVLECRVSEKGREYRILYLDNLDTAERDAIDMEEDMRRYFPPSPES